MVSTPFLCLYCYFHTTLQPALNISKYIERLTLFAAKSYQITYVTET